jgi:hypothetical protein
VGNKIRELCGHISSSVACCEIAYEKGWTKGFLGTTYHPNEKANVIADCLENQFKSHDLCDRNHEPQMETRVQALLSSERTTSWEKYDLETYIN